MDNPNNQNSSANLNPIPEPVPSKPEPTPTQPQPIVEPNQMPAPPPSPSPTPSWPPVSEPATSFMGSNPAQASPSPWAQDTTQTNPGVNPPVSGNAGLDLSSAWTPPSPVQPPTQPTVLPEPAVSNPWSNPQPSTWTPPVPSEPEPIPQPQIPTQPEPTPTFTPPAATPAGSINEPSPATSPLDNPWGETPANPSQPSWMNNQEAAPTDLSHLITNTPQQDLIQSAPETLVTSPTSPTTNPEVSTLSVENRKGISKWLIGVGGGLLILVIGASAYFILGIGQPSKGTTSLPATTTPQTTQVKPTLPIATTSAQPSPSTATGSASFGQVGGAPSATSAADLIRQRQGK
ncbi:MAG: hypothetical protein PHV63_00750 [Candidatus Daviesbacteria bacterium]|nr:hypothetical protein [Candidatus Daviesbacteria bacterium]